MRSEKYKKAQERKALRLGTLVVQAVVPVSIPVVKVIPAPVKAEEPDEEPEKKSYKCRVCGRTMPSAAALKGHLKKHES